MRNKLGKFGLVIVLILSFIAVPGVSTAEETEARFICLTYSDQNKVLLTWEKLPFVDEYEVHKNGKKIYECNNKTAQFIDGDITKDQTYNYQIVAWRKDQPYATSINTFAKIKSENKEDDLELKFKLNDYMYTVNGVMEGPMDTPPVVKDGRSYLVIRYITEAVGAELSWDGTERKVTISTDNKTIDLWIGKPVAKVNGEEIQIDSENDKILPFISEGRTLLPLRFVSDNLDASSVFWNGDERSITLIWENDAFTQSQMIATRDKDMYVDSVGNRYKLTGEQIGEEKVLLEKYYINKFDLQNDAINIEVDKFSVINDTQIKAGKIKSNDDGKLSLDTGQDNVEITYDTKLKNLADAEGGAWIKYLENDGKLKYWEYARNGTHGGEEQFTLRLQSKTLKLGEKSMSIQGEKIFSKDKKDTHLVFDEIDFSKLQVDSCCTITYTKNWLGRNVITDFSIEVCPCWFDLYSPAEKEFRLTGADTAIFEVKIKNESLTEKTFEIFTKDWQDFPGTIIIESALIKILPGEYGVTKVTITSEKTGDGKFMIGYGVKCEGNMKEDSVTVHLTPDNTNYEITIPDIVVPNNERKIKATGNIKNLDNETLGIILSNYTADECAINFTEQEFDIAEKREKSFGFEIIFKTDYKHKPGDILEIEVPYKDDYFDKTFQIKVVFDVVNLPIVDVDLLYDVDKDEITIDGSIDWRDHEAGAITIENMNSKKTFKNVKLPLTLKAKKNTGSL